MFKNSRIENLEAEIELLKIEIEFFKTKDRMMNMPNPFPSIYPSHEELVFLILDHLGLKYERGDKWVLVKKAKEK